MTSSVLSNGSTPSMTQIKLTAAADNANDMVHSKQKCFPDRDPSRGAHLSLAARSGRHLEQEHDGPRAVIGIQGDDLHPIHDGRRIYWDGLHPEAWDAHVLDQQAGRDGGAEDGAPRKALCEPCA